MKIDHRCDIFSLGFMIHELFTGEVPHGKGHRLIADVAAEYGYLDEIVTWMTQQAPDSRPTTIDDVRLRLLAKRREVTARRQLDSAKVQVVSRTESTDALIASPPRLVDMDFRDGTLFLKLSSPVTSSWIQSFQNTNYQRAQMGAGPADFSFSGAQATLAFRYNAPTPQNVQGVVDDFKRFLDLGAAAYKEKVDRELRRREEEAQRQKAKEIDQESKRLEVLKNVKI
jgi:hypothetical protein